MIQAHEQQGEFSISQPTAEILLSQESPGQLAQIEQHLIASLVAPANVDLTEVVDIEAQEGKGMSILSGSPEFTFSNLQEGPAVGHACDGAMLMQAT
jgi:hypothetical protein